MSSVTISTSWADQEFVASLPNCRPQMRRTLAKGAQLLSDNPHQSFSEACGPHRRIFGRVLADQRLTPSTILAGHRQATEQRIKDCPDTDIILATDTVFFTYPGHKSTEGLRPIQGNINGVVQHNVLAMRADDGTPLGVPVAHNWTRGGHQDTFDVESQKWWLGLDYANELAPLFPQRDFIVINDREADIHALFRAERAENVHLVQRVHQPRRYEQLDAERRPLLNRQIAYLTEMADNLPVLGYHEVEVYRNQRLVRLRLELRSSPVRVFPDKDKSERLHSAQGFNLVVAREVGTLDKNSRDIFKAEQAAEWLLLTTLAVDELDQAINVVGYYAKRWRVERLHYTMKSGALDSEKLQFDDVVTLCNALIVNTIVAWQILCLCYEARREESLPARLCLNDDQLAVLSLRFKRSIETLADASLCIGQLVNFEHSKSQPLPGVKKLSRGLAKLNAMCELYQHMK